MTISWDGGIFVSKTSFRLCRFQEHKLWQKQKRAIWSNLSVYLCCSESQLLVYSPNSLFSFPSTDIIWYLSQTVQPFAFIIFLGHFEILYLTSVPHSPLLCSTCFAFGSYFLVRILQNFQHITGANYLNTYYCLVWPKLLQTSVMWSFSLIYFLQPSLKGLCWNCKIYLFIFFLFQLTVIVLQRSVLRPIFRKTTFEMELGISQY